MWSNKEDQRQREIIVFNYKHHSLDHCFLFIFGFSPVMVFADEKGNCLIIRRWVDLIQKSEEITAPFSSPGMTK